MSPQFIAAVSANTQAMKDLADNTRSAEVFMQDLSGRLWRLKGAVTYKKA